MSVHNVSLEGCWFRLTEKNAVSLRLYIVAVSGNVEGAVLSNF